LEQLEQLVLTDRQAHLEQPAQPAQPEQVEQSAQPEQLE
jgi:hypothetical protein